MKNRKIFLNNIVLLFCLAVSCQGEKTVEEKSGGSNFSIEDYIKPIPGDDIALEMAIVKKGEVLVAYSDCYDCHKEDSRAKGPAFRDIAKRYPANPIYIEHLARQVIRGSRGSWGYPVMSPHSEIKKEDAEAMVTYILSLRGQ
jgi:cytochrome c